MPITLTRLPQPPSHTLLSNSFSILGSTYSSVSSFLQIYHTTRQARGARGGAPTEGEQDLLRAMLTFASSGLDSMVKQLVRDALETVINSDQGAAEMFRTHIEKRMKKGEDLDYKLLAMLIASEEPRNTMISNLIEFLCGSSLQSKEQLLRVASFFNIPSARLAVNFNLLDQIFEARNQVAHEMDIDFTHTGRNRRPRRHDRIITFVNEIFRLASAFLTEVEAKLN